MLPLQEINLTNDPDADYLTRPETEPGLELTVEAHRTRGH